MTRRYGAYWRLAFFGIGMAIYHDAPLWVWLVGAICAMKITITTHR
jgi:hypothetical protein